MENLKVGIAGLGRIGKIHLNNLLQMQNVDISAAMDPNEEAQKYAKSKGVKLVFKTYKELLNVHEIKALIICTPTWLLAFKNLFCSFNVSKEAKAASFSSSQAFILIVVVSNKLFVFC